MSSLNEKPVHHYPRILEAGLNLTEVRKVHLVVAFFLTSQVMCLRESCMRENRTCSLSGGLRLARKRASSDPTRRKRSSRTVALGPHLEESRFLAARRRARIESASFVIPPSPPTPPQPS